MSQSVRGLKRAWSSLDAPDPNDLRGDHEAVFVRPLGRVAPVGLGLVGLPRWFGKRFTSGDPSAEAGAEARYPSGTNLLRTADGGLAEVMPMLVREGMSLLDGRPAVVIEYAPGTRRPWPWVRDELRRLDDTTLVGMTVVDVPVFRWMGGTPFLLRQTLD